MSEIEFVDEQLPTYPAISDSGDVVTLFTTPLFPKPVVRSTFTNSRCNGMDEDLAISEFLDLLEFDRDRLGRILRFELDDSQAQCLLHLPRIVDLSTSGEPRIALSLAHSAIQRVLVLDARARLTTWWFVPYTWSVDKFQIFYLGPAQKPPCSFSWSDDQFDMYEAQSLFDIGINHNIGIQQGLSDVLADLGSRIEQGSENYQHYLSLACKLVILVKHHDDLATISALAVDILVSWGVTFQMATSAWKFIVEHCYALLPGFQAQVNAGDEARSLTLMLTCLCAIIGSNKLPNKVLIDSVLHRTANLGKAVHGYSTLADAFKPIFDSVYATCYEFMWGVPPEQTQLEELLADLKQWFLEVHELTTLENQDQIHTNFPVCRKIEILYKCGLDFSKRMEAMKISPGRKEPFVRHWMVLSKIYDRVIVQGARKAAPRTEPVCIHLWGDSGVGKSGLVYLLSQDVCAVEGLASNFMDEIYFRNVEQEFFDGYHGQLVTVYDDFGQTRDTQTNPNPEFMELIRSRNIAPWPLHMAHLEDKARTFFKSRACILTSNKKSYHISSLTHADALTRRLDLQAEVRIKPQYRLSGTTRLDISKLNGEPLNLDIYEFYMCDPSNDREYSSSVPLNYEQFSKRVVDLYRKCYKDSTRRLEFLMERGKRLDTEFVAQVNDHVIDTQISFDRILMPIVWLSLNNHYDAKVLTAYIELDHVNELVRLAMDCENYHAFCLKCAEYCEQFQIDLCKMIDNCASFKNLEEAVYQLNEVETRKKRTSVSGYVLSLYERLRSNILTTWTEIRDKHAGKLVAFATVIGGVMGLYAIRKIFNNFKFSDVQQLGTPVLPNETYPEEANCNFTFGSQRNLVGESRELEKSMPRKFVSESRELEKSAPRRFVGESRTEKRKKKFVGQATLDQNAQELMSPFAKNTYIVYTKRDGEWKRVVNGVFIRGRCMMMVAHARKFLGEDCIIRSFRQGQGLSFKLSEVKFIDLLDGSGNKLDAMLLVMPRRIPAHKNIVDHFMQTSDLCTFKNISGYLLIMKEFTSDGNRYITPQTNILRDITAIDSQQYNLTTTDKRFESWDVRSGYMYSAETQSGDCSALLVASCSALPRKILGIHVAGSRHSGYAIGQLITQKMLTRALTEVPFEAQLHFTYENLSVNEELIPICPAGDFLPIGKVARPVPAAVKTDIRQSPLYGLIKEPSTGPAILRPKMIDGVLHDPLMKGLEKCGTPSRPVDLVLLTRCKKAVLSTIQNSRITSAKQIFSISDAIKGIEGDEFIKPINRSTSPGYPWIFDKDGTKGKTKWLGQNEDFIVDNPDVVAACEERVLKARLGIRLPTVWVDTLKDERRPLEKIAACKTRVFSAGSMDYLIVFRQYFLAFNAHLMRNKIFNGSAVGINPYSTDWHILASHLKKKGPKVFAGDFCNFDGTLLSEILWAILDLINDWYDDGDDNRTIRTVLFLDIVNSIHLHGDNLYQWSHSQPSGNPLTAILNTLYNLIVMRYVFVLCTDLTLKDFDNYVYIVAFGDDNAVNVSDKIIHLFNQITVSEAFDTLGMKYTDEGKTGNMIPFRELKEITFLKRGFRYDSDLARFVGPLELDVVLEMPMWVKGDIDHDERCRVVVDKAYGELAIHGEDIFNKWTPKIATIASQCLASPPVLYDYLDYVGLDLERN
jgi:hypothetical protein